MLPEQGSAGGVTHCPLPLQVWPPEQLPQEPPQPSSPQVFPEQFGVQQLLLRSQTWPGIFAWQILEPHLQWPSFESQLVPAQSPGVLELGKVLPQPSGKLYRQSSLTLGKRPGVQQLLL